MNKTYVIAEAGVNHNGSMPIAIQLIDAAAEAGADAVKFQTFKADQLVTPTAEKAKYQQLSTDHQESQFEMLKKLELSQENHELLIDYCEKKSITFLSTPFDLDSLQLLLHHFQLPVIKISSGDITNAQLLLKSAEAGVSIILSTGMSTLGEVETALSILAFGYLNSGDDHNKPSLSSFQEAYISEQGRKALQSKVTLLHCTTEYPAPFIDVNLKVMDTFRQSFGIPVGYSDHTSGVAIPIAAVARGATVIEKHFTLDRMLPGPDHKASLEPDELKQMIQSIRQVELALGQSTKGPTPSELGNRMIARKSIVAARDIIKGEILTEDILTVKRPGDGIAPIHLWDIIGKPASRDFHMNERIQL